MYQAFFLFSLFSVSTEIDTSSRAGLATCVFSRDEIALLGRELLYLKIITPESTVHVSKRQSKQG